jgi:hypothetical protein
MTLLKVKLLRRSNTFIKLFRMRTFGIFLAVGIAIAVGYWLLSPLVIDKTVDDAFPVIEQDDEDARETSTDGEDQTDAVEQRAEIMVDILTLQVDPEVADRFEQEMIGVDQNEDVDDAMPEMEEQDATNESVSTEPVVLTVGSFVDVAHHGSGIAKIIRLADGSHILRIEDLDVLNGPDLRVYVSEHANVKKSSELGEYVELGKLKGNKGNQNYKFPADADIEGAASVVIYCKPFSVVFNTATLK